MGQAYNRGKVKLIIGLFTSDAGLFSVARRYLERSFGKVDFESAILDFDHTDYYKKEFGDKLKRKFLGFEKLVPLKSAYKTKVRTNAIEKKISKSGRRTINIDPGYMDLSKLVLFSTKDYSHRIYLDKGIFAEITLFYKDKKFNSWPWTYPDYKTEAYMEIFNTIRENFKRSVS